MTFILAGALLYALFFACASLFLLSYADKPDDRSQIRLALVLAAFITAILLAILFMALYVFVFSPLKIISREMRIIGSVNPEHLIELKRRHFLGDFPEAVNNLGESLMKARREIAEAVSAGSADLEDRKERLDTILSSLREGVIVCDERARVMFYNPAARRVFHDSEELGLGRSLYQLCAASPIENSLDVLKQRMVRHPENRDTDNDISFVCSTLIGTIISCSMRLLPVLPGLSWSFLLTCEDISRETDDRARRDNLLRAAVKGMQSPLTSLSLSADSLDMLPDMDAPNHAALEYTIAGAARDLTLQYDVLAREIEAMEPPRYLVSDVSTEDVVACAARRLQEKGLRLTMIGDPLWVKTDIHSLLLLLEFLALKIHEFSNVSAIEGETLMGDRLVYFNFIWHGQSVPESEIRRWKSCLMGSYSVHTVLEILDRLGSEIWSRPHDTPGFALLSFPLPSSTRQWEPPLPALPARPVYTDFSVSDDTPDIVQRKDLPLDRIQFVVFDTETTGLAPLEGDEIVSLAGVKIVNSGILIGETFDRMVNPGRGIPQSSVRFHGITDDMVLGKPSIHDVLRLFHGFAGDAVLVGHNAAFDMRFIRLKEKQAGVRFRRPVLDTLTLSRYLHDHTPEHSLDAIARRLGVEIRGRHTALGDSLITAQIFIKFFYLLQERGITTLGRVMELSHR